MWHSGRAAEWSAAAWSSRVEAGAEAGIRRFGNSSSFSSHPGSWPCGLVEVTAWGSRCRVEPTAKPACLASPRRVNLAVCDYSVVLPPGSGMKDDLMETCFCVTVYYLDVLQEETHNELLYQCSDAPTAMYHSITRYLLKIVQLKRPLYEG
ncbi:hypothetical protein NDU88_006520 [Pleurodeles waltl]|uniref:Uncharacterized protein n=1 Tax=Pleurodeles waltl TaxID=8319 RepID=A0AAV7MZG7_PLEWA|nr:hypothetical protein NDU88_006520 [Pleurodeles waltl]